METEIEEGGIVETHEEWALRRKRERMIVTPFQGRAALQQMGLLDAVDEAIATLGDPMASLAWDRASFRRLSPTLAAVAGLLGLTDEQLDELFELAAQIHA